MYLLTYSEIMYNNRARTMKTMATTGPTKRITSTSYTDSGSGVATVVTGGWVDGVVAGVISVSYMDKYMHAGILIHSAWSTHVHMGMPYTHGTLLDSDVQ